MFQPGLKAFGSVLFFTAYFLCSGSFLAAGPAADWQNLTTVEQLWRTYPHHIRRVVSALDLSHEGLKNVAARLQQGDTLAATRALLAYYRQSPAGKLLTMEVSEADKNQHLNAARQLRSDTIAIGTEVEKIPRRADGGLYWEYLGPNQDAEFGYSLNGHKYLVSLITAWQQTHDAAYVKTFDRLIRDWILHNPLPAPGDSIYLVPGSSTLDWRDLGEVVWRDLEAGNRLGMSWPQAFYAFQSSEAFTPAARLLMLSGIVEHAQYVRKYHKKGHNWTTMEMNGLALAGLTFPEFREADAWATYAMQVMVQEIQRQVYPDGLQTELSTKTQWVALQPFEGLASNFRKAGRPVQESYTKRLEEMYNYLAYAMRPDGHQPLNNDSDREDLRPRVLNAARTYHRPDWEWIATNGSQGQQPDGLPSVTFPWAGIHVMRSGWEADAHWAFFDTGPFGTGHQHSDMLHLSVVAYGQDLLVDGGRYTHKDYFSFDPTVWRGYFRSTFSHNTLLIDGQGQKAGPLRASAPLDQGKDYLSTPEFDYAQGAFASGYTNVEGQATHTRAVLYVRDNYWIVVDRVATDRPRQVQALWHFAPSCEVRIEGQSVGSANAGQANLRIVPAGATDWHTEIVKGQEKPHIQGWYSADYGQKVPSPTAVYTKKISGPATFAWVLVPASGLVPEVQAQLVSQNEKEVQVRVTVEGQPPVLVTVPLQPGTPRVR
jgi:hypothetical protein